jgi:ankyrin repeat protein
MKFWLGIVCSVSAVWAADVSNARIQDAAARAVAIIQKSQKNWYAKQSCFSCHQQVLPALAFQTAREHGIALDEQAAHADAARGFGFFANLDRAVEYTHLVDPALDDGYGLLAGNAAGLRPSLVTAVYARLLAARQESDGHWETVDQRPPESYSPFTATAVSLEAIQTYGHPSQRADIQARVERARAWLLSHTPRATEERVFQLRGARFSGADPAILAKLGSALKATQESDGGWSSLEGRDSEAYSTGQALVALNEAGLPISDPAWQRGIDYLLRTQAKDGSWHVPSRLHPPAPVSPPYFETGHPYEHDQFISAMGESWAVMALARALGPAGKTNKPVLKEAELVDIEPWAETLLFGSVADVKRLLDGGFDPNSTTKSGGLTALMLAAPDVGKMKLLIDRGANADGRAKNRYSPLLVAAQYPGSTKAMELLLDHGAKVRLPKGQGAALFNAFPTVLAAFSGNAEIIGRLHREGDRLDDKMNVLGMFPETPMLMLATTHRIDSAQALLDAGAKVDEADSDGITLLAWAAISNRVDMARLLIQRGADVNHVDKKGMTPLLYAASVDFGESAMIDLLLKSGAHADVRTKEGLTALDLARKYKHTHLLASLQ